MTQEIELKILAYLIRNSKEIPRATCVIKRESFKNLTYGYLYDILKDRYALGQSVDSVSLKACFAIQAKYDKDGVDELFSSIRFCSLEDFDLNSALNILNDCFVSRRLRSMADDIEAKVEQGEHPGQIIAYAEDAIRSASELSGQVDQLWTLGDLVDASPEKHSVIYDATRGKPGILSPWPSMNELIGAFRPGRVYGIAARPSSGKSAVVSQLAFHAASLGSNVLMFSHEMSRDSIWRRIASCYGNIRSWDMETGELSKSEIEEITEWIERNRNIPLYISDCSGKTINSFLAELRRFKATHGKPDVVIVDYLQLMAAGTKSGKEYDEVTAISGAMRTASREFDAVFIPVIQLNRGSEDRKDMTPRLSDLRGSGAIEQDVDSLMFVHRPEIYATESTKKELPKGYTEFIIAKQRHGAIGIVKTIFNAPYCRFEEKNEYNN